MELGFIGLGKMGMNMVTRLRRDQHRVVVYDRSNDLIKQAEGLGCIGSSSLADLVGKLSAPKAVWVMVPSGAPTEETIKAVAALLQPGDTIVDGGNTRFHDDVRRAAELKTKGIHYVDAGTSGGIWGLTVGYCLMVGGEEAVVQHLAPVFKTLAPENGWAHVGAVGAGHYVKMVHNGIEYSMMQGYAEGFELMSKSEYKLNLARIADLSIEVENKEQIAQVASISSADREIGEMIADAIEKDVPVPTLTTALFTRFRSRQEQSFAEKMLAALRNAFGGHAVRKS
jgi:6-phosphogluconate dehydrogenase